MQKNIWIREARSICAAMLFFVVLASGFVRGQNATWNSGGRWSDGSSWLGGVPAGNGGVAIFVDLFAGNIGLGGSPSISNDANPSLSGLVFDSDFRYRIYDGTISLATGPFELNAIRRLGYTLDEANIFLSTGHEVQTALTGTTSSFNKSGLGTITLSSPANNFVATNGINFTAGELRITAGNSTLGASSNSLNFDGGALRVVESALATSRSVSIGGNGATFRSFAGMTFNGNAGQVTGVGTLIREGQGAFTISSDNAATFTGAIRNGTGTFLLNGNGTLGGTAAFDLAGNLSLDNTAFGNNNRINDARPLTSRGAEVILAGNATNATSERMGNLILETGNSLISVSASSTLSFAGLVRNNRSTAFLRGLNLGLTNQIVFDSSPGSLIGGGGNRTSGVTNISISPIVSGSRSNSGSLPDLVSWDSSSGRVYVLDGSNYSSLATAGSTSNVLVGSTTSVPTSGQTINALKLTSTLNGTSGSVLTVTSGAIVASGSPLINANLNFGNAEGILNTSSSLTINGNIAGSNGFTKTGIGNLTIRGAKTYSGVTTINSGSVTVNGSVNLASPSVFGNDASDIVLNSGSVATGIFTDGSGSTPTTFFRGFVINGGGSADVFLANQGVGTVINGNVRIINPNGNPLNSFLTLQSGDYVINGVVSGNGGIRNRVGVKVELNAENTYSGGTVISSSSPFLGIYTLGHDKGFGTGDVVIATQSTGQLSWVAINAAGGERVLSNNFDLSGGNMNLGGNHRMTLNGNIFLGGRGGADPPIIGASNDVTINGLISGGGVKFSTGGRIKLANANNYTGDTTVSGLGGTLLINNTTGSGTGYGTVNVEPDAILGGTGSILGTVSVRGTLAPGESIESLSAGTLYFQAGSRYQWETLNNSSTGADLMKVNRELAISPFVNLDLSLANLNAAHWRVGDKLTLMAYNGSPVFRTFNNYLDDSTHTFGFNKWLINYNDSTPGSNFVNEAAGYQNFITFTVTSIPEPSALMAALVFGMALTGRRRRRLLQV